MKQYSDEWWTERNGKVTASGVVKICKGVKGAYLASRKDYMAEKVIEILTEKPVESYVSKEMEWGTETEPEARTVYEAETGNIVTEVGFINHPTIGRFGASPDGLIEPGNINQEIKCPKTATHITFILNHKIKRDYIYQMNSQMMCTGSELSHFVSYDPRLPGDLSFVMVEYKKDPVICAEIEIEVKKFLAELDEMLKALKEKI